MLMSELVSKCMNQPRPRTPFRKRQAIYSRFFQTCLKVLIVSLRLNRELTLSRTYVCYSPTEDVGVSNAITALHEIKVLNIITFGPEFKKSPERDKTSPKTEMTVVSR